MRYYHLATYIIFDFEVRKASYFCLNAINLIIVDVKKRKNIFKVLLMQLCVLASVTNDICARVTQKNETKLMVPHIDILVLGKTDTFNGTINYQEEVIC